MNISGLRHEIEQIFDHAAKLEARDQIKVAALLMRGASIYLNASRARMTEDGAVTQRRQAKRRETELDPKPPVKPVRIAEPSKPRKPKYSGL